MKNKTSRTNYFNAVTNAQHGTCLMFDRKGRGISQPQRYRSNRLLIKNSFATDAFNKAVSLCRAQLKNIMLSQKQVSPLRP